MRIKLGLGPVLIPLVLACVAGLLAGPAAAQEEPPPLPAEQGPAYLIISLDQTFVYDDEGPDSQTIVVPLGFFEGGLSLEDTTFTLDDAIFVPVTSLPTGVTFESLNGNATTIIGAFQEDNAGAEIHLVNSTTDVVEDEIEEAIYMATRHPDFAGLFMDENGPLFPTTGQIVNFVADFLADEPSEEELDVLKAMIAAAIFETDDSLSLPDDSSPTIEAEGDLFPHGDYCYQTCNDCGGDGDPEPLFQFAFLVNDKGTTDFLLCNEIREVDIDIMPGSTKNPVNLKKKGLLPVALLSSSTFDAQDVDPDTVKLGGVYAVKYAVEDVDDDGYDDVIFHFSVPDLKDGGFLNEYTSSLTLTGELYDDGADVCVRGRDSVTVPPNGK